ncbi:shikimate kinase [Bacillus salitolerans]|uniref:Shikimate kinase n=1 Tax=Bacillus salitolerans TaxID=1437434 RepID=A0ABW4LPB3_9BACI
MKSIYLTGFMGSGKTTIGKQLSSKLHLPVMDTDEEISRKEGLSVRTLFEKYGEDYFRSLETSILKTIPKEDMIVTTGGGMVVREENRKWMLQNGIVFYLQCEFDKLWSRLEKDETRPLVLNQQKEAVKKIYISRQELYKEGSIVIHTTNQSVDEVVDEIVSRVKK